MRVRTILTLLFAMLLAVPAFAQEQTGSIEGTVLDSQGRVVPGVTVEAQRTNGAIIPTTSDTTGLYRFPSLPPGIYSVIAKLSGFRPAQVTDITVVTGGVKKIDFTLQIGGVSEQVTVTAETPLVDVRTGARQSVIRTDEGLPTGRNYLSVLSQAPGANFEPKSNGFMVDGATASENRYVIDGVETSDLLHGYDRKVLIADFVEEVQIKQSGYTAEYGGSTGAVINAITKSGTNVFGGSILFNYEGSALAGKTPTLRTKLADSTQAEYIEYPKDTRNRVEPGFAIGGPIAKDKMWFWAAYQPAVTKLDRSVNTTSSQNPNATSLSHGRTDQVQYLSANITNQLSNKLRSRVSVNNSWSKSDGALPSLNGTDPTDSATINYARVSTQPDLSFSANADYVASPNVVLGIRAGYYTNDVHDANVPTTSRYSFVTTNIGFVGTNGVAVPASLQKGTGFTSFLSNFASEYDKQKRGSFQADASWSTHAGGNHQFKGGIQFDYRANEVLSGETAFRTTFRWGASLSGARGPFGYYSVRSAVDTRVDPSRYGGAAAADTLRKKGFTTTGMVSTNLVGLFLQDTWTVGQRLTINAGVRTEQEDVPIYGVTPGIAASPIKFNFGDKVSPRLSFAYDVRGDGMDKISGSFGIFYDIFKLELPRGSYGGDKWTEYYYTLDTPDWTTVDTGAACPPVCSGTLLRVTDFRLPTYSLSPDACLSQGCTEPNLKPMKSREFSIGFEHQFSPAMAGGISYTHKQIDRAIEDIGTITADGNEAYVIGNPGEGIAAIAYKDDTLTVNLPKAKRNYDGVEFRLERRLRNNWFLRGSYLWSRLAGNYAGLAQTDENGRADPNVGRLYDYPLMMFQENGQPVDGPLPTDRPHQLKAQFMYMFPAGTSLGINQIAMSGVPITPEIGVYPTSNLPIQWMNRGAGGRTDVLTQTDLFLQHNFKAGTRSVQVFLNVLNVFNQESAINKHYVYQQTNGITAGKIAAAGGELAIYQGKVDFDALIAQAPAVVKDPRYLMANGFQAPIQARFGVKFGF